MTFIKNRKQNAGLAILLTDFTSMIAILRTLNSLSKPLEFVHAVFVVGMGLFLL